MDDHSVYTIKERLGVATSTYLIFYDMGLRSGPFLLGLLLPLIGYRGMFLCC